MLLIKNVRQEKLRILAVYKAKPVQIQWILENGHWDDTGIWIDDAVWVD